MKSRFTVLVILLAVMLAIATPGYPAFRTVLLEAFTQWNCGPCASWNPQERAVVGPMTRDTVVTIKYHGWWPGANNDAFHLWNVAENTARINFYGVNAVPDGVVDGTVRYPASRSQTWLRNTIRTRSAVPASCTIDLCASVAGQTAVSFQATVHAEQDLLDPNLRIFVVLIQDSVVYSSPPGTNGERIFHDPFRDMWPNSNGQVIEVAADDSAHFSGMLNKDASWPLAGMTVIAFIQNRSTRAVEQAAWTRVEYMYGFGATTTSPPQKIVAMDRSSTFDITITNVGQMEDEYTVTLLGDLPDGWSRNISAPGIPPSRTSINVPLGAGQQTLATMAVAPNGQKGIADLRVQVTSPNATCIVQEVSFNVMAGLDILLVDDDNGGTFETYFQSSLNRILAPEMLVGTWRQQTRALDDESAAQAPLIIWMTGSAGNNNTLNANELSLLDIYLSNGGLLFLTGQGIASDIRTEPFLAQQLHAVYRANAVGRFAVRGLENDPILGDLVFNINGGDGANNQTRQSAVRPADQMAIPMSDYNTADTSYYSAIRVTSGQSKVVFLGFGFEAINSAATRDTVMSRVINWLLGINAADARHELVPGTFALGQNYPNPFNPETIVPFSLAERSQVSLRVFDLLGREVAVLAEGMHEAGIYTARFNARELSSGIYFYRLDAQSRTGAQHATRKLVLMK